MLDEGTVRLDEITLVDSLLDGWGKWSRRWVGPRRQQTAGLLLGIAFERDAQYHVELGDDQFVSVDRAIRKLPDRLREAVHAEYCVEGPSNFKARHLGITRLKFRERLHAAQWVLFAALAPTGLLGQVVPTRAERTKRARAVKAMLCP